MNLRFKIFIWSSIVLSIIITSKQSWTAPPVVSMNTSRATFDDDGNLYISVTNGSDLEIRSLNRKGQNRMNWALNGSLLFNKGLHENEAEKTIALMKCDKFGNLWVVSTRMKSIKTRIIQKLFSHFSEHDKNHGPQEIFVNVFTPNGQPHIAFSQLMNKEILFTKTADEFTPKDILILDDSFILIGVDHTLNTWTVEMRSYLINGAINTNFGFHGKRFLSTEKFQSHVLTHSEELFKYCVSLEQLIHFEPVHIEINRDGNIVLAGRFNIRKDNAETTQTLFLESYMLVILLDPENAEVLSASPIIQVYYSDLDVNKVDNSLFADFHIIKGGEKIASASSFLTSQSIEILDSHNLRPTLKTPSWAGEFFQLLAWHSPPDETSFKLISLIPNPKKLKEAAALVITEFYESNPNSFNAQLFKCEDVLLDI